MVTMMIVVFLCVFSIMSINMLIPVNKKEKNRKKITAANIIIIVVFVMFLSLMIHNDFVVQNNAHELDGVKIIETDDEIFCDDLTGEYFVILCDNWNPFNVYCRKYINTETAEEYIEVYRKLQGIDVLGNLN